MAAAATQNSTDPDEAAPTATKFMQTILDGVEQPLEVIVLQECDLDEDLLGAFNEEWQPLGIAPGYSKDGRLVALAISDDAHCLIVRFFSARPGDPGYRGRGRGRGRGGRGNGAGRDTTPPPPRDYTGRKLLQDLILCRQAGDLLAFDCAELAMSLYCADGMPMRMSSGIDIQSAFSAVDRKPLTAIKDAVGESMRVFERNVVNIFQNPLFGDEIRHCKDDLANRAWVSQYLAEVDNGAATFAKVKRIDTTKFEPPVLNMLAKMVSDSLRLNHLKPNEKKHEFTTMQTNNGLGVKSGSFATRLRGGENLRMQARTESGHTITFRGDSGGVDGRSANLNIPLSLNNTKTILTIKSVGRDDPTTAEAQRAATVRSILQGNIGLLTDNPWIKNIWYPPSDDSAGVLEWPQDWSTRPLPMAPASEDNLDRLNASQREAVEAMLHPGNEHRIVLVQGPPGTGKTSVIAAYVQTALNRGQAGLWLVAKSNVAVINIAFKLQAVGFNDWRLLASRDFSHEDWHGHLYSTIKHNFIRSDEFKTVTKTRMSGCKVILCTVSMLANKWVNKSFKHYVGVNRVIVDEASQIEIGDYLPVFNTYRQTLRKMCFIGDDKQLPPYGQEDLQDLQSIFEVTHLQGKTHFLDTQYRMPPQIGAFISSKVYDNKLKSNPKHPVLDTEVACYFINVGGAKELLTNNTYSNTLEMQAVIQLAQLLQEQQKSYKIITPYDGQRVLIEDKMKATEGLDWEEKVYNVDSFQGNEEDIIIISVVRSLKLGFLENLRRTNVMLSRCKHAMYLVSSRAFLQNGAGKDCIVGELSEHVGDLGWLEMKDLESGDFLVNPRKREVNT
ncbi:AAA-12 domain-containing protein [Mycena kentingensis (nom. inval.)]|nr:AAA-12 domain-containing protein [Mycena kentingensis (nom. inval.)]